jgi:hypothetical protein
MRANLQNVVRSGVAGLALVLLAACTRPAVPDTAMTATASTDAWRGQWTGPEGTSLVIAGGQGEYEVTVRNLDGPRVFAGRAVADGIEFVRDGTTEIIRATDGPGTGMKWLTEKRDCLVIRQSEGFCRD